MICLFKITESESYRKYLFHKDMNIYRLKEVKVESNLNVDHATKDKTDIEIKEDIDEIEEKVCSC